MRNMQPPEKSVSGPGDTLAVNSVFHTIQGEGPFAGCPAVFLRLAGCNLQCPLCDTEYTARDEFTLDSILHTIRGAAPTGSTPANLVVITGGEPFRQPIGKLVRRLLFEGYEVQVETNGTLFRGDVPYHHERLTIVCSPKAGAVHRQLVPHIGAWKYVASDDNINPADGLPDHALEHPNGRGLARPPAGHPAPVYLQPVDHKNIAANARAQRAVVEACLKYGHRLCLQMHKIVGVD